MPFNNDTEYGQETTGGYWYYIQDKPGTDWFDRADNATGWTIDFRLTVNDVQNSNDSLQNSDVDGVGIHINDGTKKETIEFLTQEINFKNANHKIVYDTTSDKRYRLAGKGNQLKLYGKTGGTSEITAYDLLADVGFDATTASGPSEANGFNPSITESIDGDFFAVWTDDGNQTGRIFYSEFKSGTWSVPLLIVSDERGAQNPVIAIDNEDNVYVAYEFNVGEFVAIGVIWKNQYGWSDPTYIGNSTGDSRNPDIAFDSQYNLIVVWQDYRHGHSKIFINKLEKLNYTWMGDEELVSGTFDLVSPSIDSHMDDIFVTWTDKNSDGTSSIKIAKYNSLLNTISDTVNITDATSRPEYPDIAVNSGGRIIVVWHNGYTGRFNIYASVLNLNLDIETAAFALTDTTQTNGGSTFPTVSEQVNTGDIYIVWQDYAEDFTSFTPLDERLLDEYDPYFVDDTFERQGERPSEFIIKVAYYGYLENQFYSSATGYDDILLSATNKNTFQPVVPAFFNGLLPIIHESYNINDEDFLVVSNLTKNIETIQYQTGDPSGIESGISSITGITGEVSSKEIRFGDFANNLNAHYTFKDFRYYLQDMVEPFHLREVTGDGYDFLTSLNAMDIAVNNYGDCWLVGTCGMMYYIHENGRIALVGYGGDIAADFSESVKAITFDKYNTMFIAASDGIYYSTKHITDFDIIEGTSGVSNLGFTKENLFVYSIGSNVYVRTASIAEETYSFGAITTFALDGTVSSIAIDDNDVIWVGTYNGFYRIKNNSQIRYTNMNGLISNRVNDIAIRNTAIRYIATAGGISKMVGSAFTDALTSENGTLDNNNVKSILWQDPNVLLAGTLSRISQITINDSSDTYNSLSYDSLIYEPIISSSAQDDFQVYYIILDEGQTIENDDVLEIYINGKLITHGFTIGKDRINDENTLLFDAPLKRTDAVSVIVRKDLKLKASFEQTNFEKRNIGEQLVRIKDLAVGDELYLSVSGTDNEVKVNDSDSNLPYDKIHLDTKSPTGTITIPQQGQLDRSTVRVNITANDTFDDIAGSGVNQMIVSNYPNFTTEGFTAQEAIPFASTLEHDLGINTQNILLTPLEEGTGTSINYVGENELYYTVSNPGQVYKYDSIANEWNLLFSYDEDDYVDFIMNYNNRLIVSVGHDINVAKLYIYEYILNEAEEITGYTESRIMPFAESRAFSYLVFNNLLYIGSGLGDGNEYAAGAGQEGARLYTFDGLLLNEIISDLDDNVFALFSVPGSENIFAVTGPLGFVYEIDATTESAIPIHNDTDALVSGTSITFGGDNLIFVGGETGGIIRRSKVISNSFNISFRTIRSKVSKLKVLPIVTGLEIKDTLYALVGNVIYYLSDAGAWVWKYTHTETIHDITYDEFTQDTYVISDTGVVQLSPTLIEKTIYLKLIDRAGNETSLYDDEGELKDSLTTEISISSLVDFINDNKVLELDELGNITTVTNGTNSFYSADRIEEEKGVYVSEIFDGTNDLVKWETMAWVATEMYLTEVNVFIRTSASKIDILLEDWIGPYDNSQASGVDIGHFSGQFLQFKVELTSSRKNISPTFRSATIRAITSESIHFFTTNFELGGRVGKGILTSRKMVPVSADVVFGVNTTNSIDWNDYQIIDENRLFNINQIGENFRVGIKLISPSRGTAIAATPFDEYGPYGGEIQTNTVDVSFLNDTGLSRDYHFKVTLYGDVELETPLYSAYSFDNQEGFSVNSEVIDNDGYTVPYGSEVRMLFTVPGSANIQCNTFYYVKVETIYDFDVLGDGTFVVISDDTLYAASCNSSFIDVIDFNFTNNQSTVGDFDFRIIFYDNPERTNIFKTVFSQNDKTGWFIDGAEPSDDGTTITPSSDVNVVYRPDLEDFVTGAIYYLSIDVWERTAASYVFSTKAYTFQARDIVSSIYCGEYVDVPVVKNFGIMLELEDNQFVTLNL